MKQFTIITATMLISLMVCLVALTYFIEMGRLRTVELERQVEINKNAIHRLMLFEDLYCQCNRKPSGE